ncbi:rolling circle replication-associated protein [Bifidobacterium breve]|uniref:rolling circle replication-associated protein n=1 Tax=Bifidobacterium breve TaxID=1685 RepID=UPI00189C0758|nr:hypothetical protein [Bifidobacterium breve]
MPRLTIRRHGASACIPHRPAPNAGKPPVRQANRGWTRAAARRNAQYLQRLDFAAIRGRAYAATLTIPAQAMNRVTPERMHRWLDTLIKHLHRHGLLHYHWVIEFTARHTPHIHMTIWMDDGQNNQAVESAETTALVIGKWLAITNNDGIPTTGKAQDARPLDGDDAWLAYIAKHTQRGILHYQRALSNMPENWTNKPGAMWGHSRNTPLTNDSTHPMSMKAFHQFRRETRKWCRARAVRIKDPQRRAMAIRQARRMNRCSNPKLSPVRPISIWMPDTITRQICTGLRRQGYMIGNDAYRRGLQELQLLRKTRQNPKRQRMIEKELMTMVV